MGDLIKLEYLPEDDHRERMRASCEACKSAVIFRGPSLKVMAFRAWFVEQHTGCKVAKKIKVRVVKA